MALIVQRFKVEQAAVSSPVTNPPHRRTPVSAHPATVWNTIRHHVFSVFEKTNDIEKAMSIVSTYSLPIRLRRTFLAGMRAELFFYSKERMTLKLEPLLDAGVKADFIGFRNGELVNIDVTTNLKYKDINRYAAPTKSRQRLYEIALVDVKHNQVNSFPLRFPLCPDCGMFSHYVLFLDEPPAGSHWFASTSQELVQHCPYCSFSRRRESYTYVVPSPLVALKDVMDQNSGEFYDETFQPHDFLAQKCNTITRFFQKESNVLLSAVAEIDYIITDPSDGDGDYGGRVLWNHPLVKDLPDEIDPP